MQLTPRLLLAAQLCAGAQRVIDVGCDHGYLPIYLVQHGIRQAYASDIRPGPLASARENIEKYGLEQQIRPILCPGLEAFGPEDADTVMICGMGGEMIADILAAAPWTADGKHTLVLQPMTNAPKLRAFLAEHGYTVEAEALAKEGRHLYCVLRARGGMPPMGREQHWIFTEKMLADPLFPDYLQREMTRLQRVVEGKRLAGQDAGEEEQILQTLKEYVDAT